MTANCGKIVIISALNGTFEKKGWANILELIPLCEKIKKLSAVCKLCMANANFTFRTCGSHSQQLIGGSESYMPLCRECFNDQTHKASQVSEGKNSGSASTLQGEGSNDDEFLLNMNEIHNGANEVS
jgi:thymidine kinase